MGLFGKNKGKRNHVWRNVNGQIVCPGDACPQKCDDTCPIFLNTQCLMMMRIGEEDKALELYEEAIKIAPDFYDALNNMGTIYGKRGEYQKAYEYYLKAHQLNENRPRPVYGLALSSRDLNRLEESLEWCEKYKKLSVDGALDDVCESVKRQLGVFENKAPESEAIATEGDEYTVIEQKEGWSIVKKDKYYFFLDNNEEYAITPGGDLLKTTYLDLAKRILNDLVKYGPDDFCADSILPWHYTMVENFSKMTHEAVEKVLIDSFINRYDWTYNVDVEDTDFESIWGERGEREEEIMEWLTKITHLQMTAACCIGNAYHSLNLAYIMAIIMETYDEGDERDKKFSELVSIVNDNSDYSIAYFYDDDGCPCEKSKATMINIVEYKKGGIRINEHYGYLGGNNQKE